MHWNKAYAGLEPRRQPSAYIVESDKYEKTAEHLVQDIRSLSWFIRRGEWQDDDAAKLNDLIYMTGKTKWYGSFVGRIADMLLDDDFTEEGNLLESASLRLHKTKEDLFETHSEFTAAVKLSIHEDVYLAIGETERKYPKLARASCSAEPRLQELGQHITDWLRKHRFRVCWEPSDSSWNIHFHLFARRKRAKRFQTCIVWVSEESFRPSIGEIKLSLPKEGWEENEAISFDKEFWNAVEKLVQEFITESGKRSA
jgi:hypothetical protein